VYHLELRQFPHVVRRFNLSEREMLALAVPWAKEEWVEYGERKWNANLAKLAVLEGSHLSLQQLAMGRGWRNAQRHSEDITERLLEALKQAPAPQAAGDASGPPAGPGTPQARAATDSPGAAGAAGATGHAAAGSADAPELDLLADSIGLELLALLDQAPEPLLRAWSLAAERPPERTAGESLALAERAVRSLLQRGLIVLQSVEEAGWDPSEAERGGGVLEDQLIEPALRTPGSWAPGEQSGAILMHRA
jgi:hypothetical protein